MSISSNLLQWFGGKPLDLIGRYEHVRGVAELDDHNWNSQLDVKKL